MIIRHIAFAFLLFKDGNFCEENLAACLSLASKVRPRIKNRFTRSSDGTSLGTTIVLDSTLSFMCIGSVINYTRDFQDPMLLEMKKNLGKRFRRMLLS